MTRAVSPKNIVVYADDDADDLLLVREALSNYSSNLDLITLNNGAEALSYLKHLIEKETTPCLIILDINMPKLDGKETLTRIRELKELKNVPVILFTTSSQQLDKKFAHAYNAGFITKPIDFQQMDRIANEFINHCSDEVQKSIRKYIE
jgi:CheY-like chemotaxis protein